MPCVLQGLDLLSNMVPRPYRYVLSPHIQGGSLTGRTLTHWYYPQLDAPHDSGMHTRVLVRVYLYMTVRAWHDPGMGVTHIPVYTHSVLAPSYTQGAIHTGVAPVWPI